MVVFAGFSDSEVAAMNPEAAELADRLDLSMSSIDMTNTSLAMHEEREGEISGVGESMQQPLSLFHVAGAVDALEGKFIPY